MKMIRRLAALLLLSCAVTACAPLGPIDVTPTQTYVLNTSPINVSPIQLHKSIAVLPIFAAHGFESNAMMYEEKPYLLAAFAENAWIAPPASMITVLLAQTLQQSQAFSIVLAGPTLSVADYSINVALINLYQDFTVNPSEIVVGFNVLLVKNSNNKALGEKVFQMRLKTAENTPYAGVQAANQAVSTLLGQISQYLITTIAAQKASSS